MSESHITKDEIEKRRSPQELRAFVIDRIAKINENDSERHQAILKKGLYKKFRDEIVPLSIFCAKIYPDDYRIQPDLGSQGYDASVYDKDGNRVEYVELSFPSYDKIDADDDKLVVSRGYSPVNVYDAGDNLKRRFENILRTCKEKALKDYSGYSLVFVVDFIPPFPQDANVYSAAIRQLVNQMQTFTFKAERTFLLIMPSHETIRIDD